MTSKRSILPTLAAGVAVVSGFMLAGYFSRLWVRLLESHSYNTPFLIPFALYPVFVGIAFFVVIYRKRSWFLRTRITILVGVPILGYILMSVALISLPHVNSSDYQKQDQTLASLKAWSVALNKYGLDAGGFIRELADKKLQRRWRNVSYRQIEQILKSAGAEQSDFKELNPQDSWGNAFEFCIINAIHDNYDFYVRSSGKDGLWEANRYLCWAHDAYDYDSDIIIGKDRFYRWPNINFVSIDPEWETPHKVLDHKVVP